MTNQPIEDPITISQDFTMRSFPFFQQNTAGPLMGCALLGFHHATDKIYKNEIIDIIIYIQNIYISLIKAGAENPQ